MDKTTPVSAHLPLPHVAALSVALAPGLDASGLAPKAPAEFRLLPIGRFRAADGSGRPEGIPEGWLLDAETAARLASQYTARASRMVIDYEHQTLHAASNGQPAPAGGWIGQLEARADGLYAVEVEWTAAAAAMIEAREYRYISPVFSFDATGQVLELLHAALTNSPGLDGLTDLAQLAAVLLPAASTVTPTHPSQETFMDDLLEQLRWLLNLPVGATAADVSTQLQKLIDQLKPGAEPGMAAAAASARFDLAGHLARLTAASDPSQYVGIATLAAVQAELSSTRAELAALHAKQWAAEVDALVAAALQDGRLTPALESWARDLGSTRIDALKGFVERATPILPAPGSTQTGGVPPPRATAGDADTPAAIARAALAWQAAQAAAGNVVSTAAAVAHVLPPHLANLSTLNQGA